MRSGCRVTFVTIIIIIVIKGSVGLLVITLFYFKHISMQLVPYM